MNKSAVIRIRSERALTNDEWHDVKSGFACLLQDSKLAVHNKESVLTTLWDEPFKIVPAGSGPLITKTRIKFGGSPDTCLPMVLQQGINDYDLETNGYPYTLAACALLVVAVYTVPDVFKVESLNLNKRVLRNGQSSWWNPWANAKKWVHTVIEPYNGMTASDEIPFYRAVTLINTENEPLNPVTLEVLRKFEAPSVLY